MKKILLPILTASLLLTSSILPMERADAATSKTSIQKSKLALA
ncbi:hypothetical protein [Macrococcus animalis]